MGWQDSRCTAERVPLCPPPGAPPLTFNPRAHPAAARPHQHERAAGAAQHVGPGALEEGARALLGRHLAPAVQGAVVLALAASLQSGGLRTCYHECSGALTRQHGGWGLGWGERRRLCGGQQPRHAKQSAVRRERRWWLGQQSLDRDGWAGHSANVARGSRAWA